MSAASQGCGQSTACVSSASPQITPKFLVPLLLELSEPSKERESEES